VWRLSLRSCDGREQPAGLGWHPYFLHRAGSRLQTRVAGRWEPGEDALPCRRTELPGLDLALAGAGLDHCFDGWSGEARVHDARHTLLLSASTRHLVVFTPPGAAHFCVEPVSHVNNAVQDAEPLAQGLVALAPGARLEAWMRLQRRDPIPSESP
jgi:aldose 1-epimerase